MKASFCLLFIFLAMFSAPFSSGSTESITPRGADRARVLLIPLDDRPPCLQWPTLLGPIGHADVITPPRELLGRFMTPGEPEAIAEWIRAQDLIAFDAIIVSLDMLAYGGLVASRAHNVDTESALRRLQLIEEIRERHPALAVYGFNIIMRLAPTADGTNDAWRGALARWAELSGQTGAEPGATDEVTRLEERIPPEALDDYKRARARNLAVNRAAVRMVAAGDLDYLILGQDDAKPQGIHVDDRTALLAKIDALAVKARVAVQPGADEVAMLLLARVLTDRFAITPTIKVVYSSEAGRGQVAPYEDRPLHETVSLQIAAAGARETTNEDADLRFYVFTSRHEEEVADAFAERIARDVQQGRRAIVADIDTRGDLQGASAAFTEALRKHGVFRHLFGYASWNTAGNTIGTAIPQGVLYELSTRRSAEPGAREAQLAFLLQRLINDYAYHSLVRPEVNRDDARARGMNPLRLSPAETEHLQQIILGRVSPLAEELWQDFQRPFPGESDAAAGRFSDLRLTLPWGRTFEAEIDFAFSASWANGGPDQSEEEAGDFTFHGVAAEVSRSRGAVVVEAADGDSRLAVWLHDHRGGYGLVMIDPDSGQSTFHEVPFSTWDSPFAVLYSKRGYLYTLFAQYFLEFDPRTGEFTHVEPSKDRVAMWMTEGDDGIIWAGNYPAAHLISFDPKTRVYHDYGAVNQENWPQYPRAVATDASGWIYTMIGFTNNHILALDPRSGQVRPMVDDGERSGGNVTLWRGEDGNVYARMPRDDAAWLRLRDGKATPLDGAPPAARAAEISDSQQAFFGQIPDGREITRLNVPDGWLQIRDQDGTTRRVPFNYPSQGSWIYALAVGPDERIYGSTGHPLRFFAYDPAGDSFWDVPVSGGHVNAMAVQAGKLYGAIYTEGVLIEYEPGREGSADAPNPRRRASAGDILLRPHHLLAHSDGRHVIQVGTPGYGRTGGGMMVYDIETGEAKIHPHTDLIEFHSTKALAELPDGNLIGGTTTEPGTGGERLAGECLLYIMEWPSLEIVYQEAILPGVQEIRELMVGPDDLVYGLDVEGTFFVFDWRGRELVHQENLTEHYGPITGGQAPRVWAPGPNGIIYGLFRRAIVRIEPGTFAHEKLADTPVDVHIGVALQGGRLYFTSGSHLWSYQVPELQ